MTILNINQDPVFALGPDTTYQVIHDGDPETTQYSFTPKFTVSDFDNDCSIYSFNGFTVELSEKVAQ